MSFNIYDSYTALTKNYYGLSGSSVSDQEKIAQLNNEFYARLTPDQAASMAIITGTNASTVLPALLFFEQQIIDFPRYQPYEAEITAMLTAVANNSSQWNDDMRRRLCSGDFDTVSGCLTDEIGIQFLPTDPHAFHACQLALDAISGKMTIQNRTIPPLYSVFFQEKLQDVTVYDSEATVALSPNEIEQRRIVFEIFNLALSMLAALQKSSTLAGTLMSYYTNVQREYMDLISQIQLYGPTGKYKILANSVDFGKTELGYANTTIRSVLDYLIKKIQTTDIENGEKTTTWYSLSKEDDNIKSAPLAFTLTERNTSTGEKGYVFSILNILDTQDPTIVFSTKFCSNVNGFLSYAADGGVSGGTDSSLYVDHLYLLNDSLGVVQQQQDLATRLLEHLTKQWNQTSDTYATFGPLHLADLKNLWTTSGTEGSGYGEPFATYLYGPAANAWVKDDEDDQDEKNAASSFRSETNAQIQIYLQSAQSLKQLAEDTGKRAESVLSQIQQSQENQISLITSIIESLRGLLTAIFR